MQEIIKISQTIIGTEELNSINARDLWEKLEIKQQFSDWIKKQIQSLGLEQNIDYVTISHKSEIANGGFKNIKQYIITLDTAKHISMASRTTKGKEVRQYFIQAEKKLKNIEAGDNKLFIQFMTNQQKTNETILKLLETLISNQKDQVKTISKDQMKSIKSTIYIVAGVISEYYPMDTRENIQANLYRELNAHMGVSSYYDIPSESFNDAIKLLNKTKTK